MKIGTIFLSFFFTLCIGSFSLNAQTSKSKEVTKLIQKKRVYNKKNGFGYRIQLYYGLETKARKELKLFNIEFPTIKTHIDFINPEWKSQVGDYRTRLEADKTLNTIKNKFPYAIVVPR